MCNKNRKGCKSISIVICKSNPCSSAVIVGSGWDVFDVLQSFFVVSLLHYIVNNNLICIFFSQDHLFCTHILNLYKKMIHISHFHCRLASTYILQHLAQQIHNNIITFFLIFNPIPISCFHHKNGLQN